MSVEAEENIKSLIPKEIEPEKKIPMYHSKYSSAIRDEVKKHKFCHQTMGYAQIHLDPPNKFLKKKTRLVRRPFLDKAKLKYQFVPKAPVPSAKVATKKEKKSEKNFRKQNILHVMRSVPKKPMPAFADTTRGNTQKLIPSGLMPQFIHGEGFGKVPQYLTERQKKLQERVQNIEAPKKTSLLRYVTEDERQELLDGLKKNWEELQKEFQLLPMVTDTVPKVKRKTQLEKELKSLEKDIDLIERNPVIFVNESDKKSIDSNRLQDCLNKKLSCSS